MAMKPPPRPPTEAHDWLQAINHNLQVLPSASFYIYKVISITKNFPFHLDFLGVLYKRHDFSKDPAVRAPSLQVLCFMNSGLDQEPVL